MRHEPTRRQMAPALDDVLFLIARYLRERKLFRSVSALLSESGLDPVWLCGPSREIHLLREWILSGDLQRALSLVEPLTQTLDAASGASAANALRKLQSLEAFFHCDSPRHARPVMLRRLQMEHELTERELEQCLAWLADVDTSWSCDEARLNCFEQLARIFRGEIQPEDAEHKYLAMPPLQLSFLITRALEGSPQAWSCITLPCQIPALKSESQERVEALHLQPEQSQSIALVSQSVDWSGGSGSLFSQAPQAATERRGNPLARSMGSGHRLKIKQPQQDRDDSVDQSKPPVVVSSETQTEETESNEEESCSCDVAIQTETEEPAEAGHEAFNAARPDTGKNDDRVLPETLSFTEEEALEIVLEELESVGTTTDDEEDHATEHQVPAEAEEPPDQELCSSADGYDETRTPQLLQYSRLGIDEIVRAHVVAEVSEAQAVRAIDVSPDGSELVIGTNARTLRVFNLSSPLQSQAARAPTVDRSFRPLLPVVMERYKHHASAIYCVAYDHSSGDGQLVASGSANSSIKVLNRATDREHWIRSHAGKTRALHFASRDALWATCSEDLRIRCWDLNWSLTTARVQLDGHVGEIQTLAFPADHEQASCFLSSALDRTIRLWDARSAHCERIVASTPHTVFAMAFHPRLATHFASAGQNGAVDLWDLRHKRAPIQTLRHHHEQECRALSWSPNGAWLVSGGFDWSLCLMEWTQQRTLQAVAAFQQHEDKVLQAQWLPQTPALVTTSADKSVKLWSFG